MNDIIEKLSIFWSMTSSLLEVQKQKLKATRTYRALQELEKAVKTIFQCRYLTNGNIRREINEGLNEVEN
ncbi:Tn3 family transposase [Allomuricauda sp. SCSIO 64092]|uniref:Tn3 family transposase n=1 Tax=Allomuricauda sp. SCSIO 64092 TaxID=2908842 RepID=UPI00248ACE9B|nr:Tn3 family transposase [Muricauda sp. SCSIO 64092]